MVEQDRANLGKGKVVLLVDDDPTSITMVKAVLEKFGFQVLTAKNGKEGVEMATRHSPHVIIADVLMPVMDGFEFLEEIKGHRETKMKPILIVTARHNLEDNFMKSGADGFIIKPIDTESLIQTVTKLCK